MEAQRYPADYDGILAGAPANNWARMMTNAVAGVQAMAKKTEGEPGSYIPPTKLPAISVAVNAACDKLDGVTDGVLNDPRECRFDPATMLCKGAETDACLTAPQVTTLKALYAGAHDSTGRLVFPGYVPGAEGGTNGWALWITGLKPDSSLMHMFGTQYFSNMVYGDADWDYKTFSVDAGLAMALKTTSVALDSTDPDLKAFADRGGKLILYHGWNDPAISSLNTVNYYESVVGAMGEDGTRSAVRLFMAPGVQHCGGGPGPDSFGQFGATPSSGPADAQHDLYAALEVWVEKGVAPEQVIASKMEGEGAARHATVTRPLCAYPKVAKYKGTGDVNDAVNFVCVAKP